MPAVGSTAFQPRQSTKLRMRFRMHAYKDGQHTPRVHGFTDDPSRPECPLTALSNRVE